MHVHVNLQSMRFEIPHPNYLLGTHTTVVKVRSHYPAHTLMLSITRGREIWQAVSPAGHARVKSGNETKSRAPI